MSAALPRWRQRPQSLQLGRLWPDEQIGRLKLLAPAWCSTPATSHPRSNLSARAGWLRAHRRSRFLRTAPTLRLPGAVGAPATPVATV